MYLIQRSPEPGCWRRVPIPDSGLALRRGGTGGAEIAAPGDAAALALVFPYVQSGSRRAALISEPGARGLLLAGRAPLGVQALEERAEIELAGERLYFTEREPLRVAPFVAAAADTECAVCAEPVQTGDRVIACTGCRAVAHEGERAGGDERLCFSHHGDRCAGCQLTRAEFEWTPEEGA